MRIDPFCSDLMFEVEGTCHFWLGNYQDSINSYKKLKIDTRDSLFYSAACYKKMGNNEKATEILKQAKTFITLNKSSSKKIDILRGKTQINLFFEPSTRTQSSFELAGKRLGADVMSMNIVNSAIKKGDIYFTFLIFANYLTRKISYSRKVIF